MAGVRGRLRKLVPGTAAIVVLLTVFFVASSQESVSGAQGLAQQYKFTELPIALPPGYNSLPMKTVRQVNPAYQHVSAWLSSIGAGIAINDFTGHGRADSMCIVDPRTDDVIMTYTPTAPQQDQFTPFVLDAAPLPMDATMAPTSCTPGDFTGDGRMGILVTYFGRTPIVFLPKSTSTTLSASSYVPRELLPSQSLDGKYHGPKWNTSTASVDDYAGNGRPDIIIGNYFPDSDVLDPNGANNVVMNQSLSNAGNSGGDHVFRWFDATSGATPNVNYIEDVDAIPYFARTGWTLAIASADLTGTGLADVYIANDFGHDYLLNNVSTPNGIKFTVAIGQRTPTTPKSFVLGQGSFKGMGADFVDLSHNGRFDIPVSNITTAWGLQESNFMWMNGATSDAQMKQSLDQGIAPFTQQAEQLGMAWTGWGWDLKGGDFLNSGNQEIIQTTGFVKGTTDRWNWLQEMAMTNDDLLINPAMWPNIVPGDDVAGHQVIAFYARGANGKGDNGKFVNISTQLGLGVQIPTRGVAIGDTTGTGRLDFAVARQWGPPAFYANQSPGTGDYIDLRLYRPSSDGKADDGLQNTGTPAYGATVTLTTPDGRSQVSELDGGSGHSGRRSFEVHFGLGAFMGTSSAHLAWRDLNGGLHQQTLNLTTGTHTIMLSNTAQEVPTR